MRSNMRDSYSRRRADARTRLRGSGLHDDAGDGRRILHDLTCSRGPILLRRAGEPGADRGRDRRRSLEGHRVTRESEAMQARDFRVLEHDRRLALAPRARADLLRGEHEAADQRRLERGTEPRSMLDGVDQVPRDAAVEGEDALTLARAHHVHVAGAEVTESRI